MPSRGTTVAEDLAYTILEMRVEGTPVKVIAEKLGLDLQTVNYAVREAADLARRERKELVDQQFMLNYMRTESLYSKAQETLNRLFKMPDSLAYHKEIMDTIRVMLLILAQQSKLMGLDAQKTAPNKPFGLDWITDPNTPEERLISEAKRLGVRMPVDFAGEEACRLLPVIPPGVAQSS